MKFYLLEKPQDFTGEADMLDFHRLVDYRDFDRNQMYRMPQRLIIYTRHKEYGEYPEILLDPLPLFSEKMWKGIGNFMEKPLHTQFILMDEKTRHGKSYYTPAFRRISAKVMKKQKQGKVGPVELLLKEAIPEDVPALYLQEERRVWVMVRLDLLESFMRLGLRDIRLLPIEGEEVENGNFK